MTQSNSTKCADKLGEIEDALRLMEFSRDRARADLAAAILAEGGEMAISSTGKTYKLSRPSTKYEFNVPKEELERLGILADLTPPPSAPEPKLNKTELDKLLKKRKLTDETVAEWQRQRWYVIDRSDEITVKQVETKMETLKQVMGK